MVYREPGRFCGWPANNGIWIWGNEILVGFYQADYVAKDCGHSHGGNGKRLLARSLDGGESWSIEDPDNFAGDGGQAVACPGGIDFAHPDFAMRMRGNRFFVSDDRGKTWQGSYKLPTFGIETPLTARTDYIVNGERDCLILLSAREPRVEAAERDRAFCARTKDGGKTFEFVSWMTDEPIEVRSVMPSTVRCSANQLISAMRRRRDVSITGLNKIKKCWIDVYQSNDNGQTWEFLSQAADTGTSNGNPPSLVRLRDGRMCVTYGVRSVCSAYRYRWEPQGIRARISDDNGKSWGWEIVLRSDALTWDLGYTRSVQRPDGMTWPDVKKNENCKTTIRRQYSQRELQLLCCEEIMQMIGKERIRRGFRGKLPWIVGAIVIVVLVYFVVCKACIDSLSKDGSLSPDSYGLTTTFDLFVVEKLTPLTYGIIDFTGSLQEIQVLPDDAKLFERELGLYWGERVQVGDANGMRFIALLVYGEKRSDKLLDKAIDYLYSGYVQEKSKNHTPN
jgi:hypothetical protein